MRLQGHAAVKVPMAFAGKLLAGKQGAAEEVAEVAEVAGDTERVHNGGSKALQIYIDKAGARSLTPTPRAPSAVLTLGLASDTPRRPLKY